MVLVTGATGLVGSHLVILLLEQNENVRAIYRNPASLQKTKALFDYYHKSALFDSIDWVLADITDVFALELAFDKIQQVYHCAACISFDPKDEKLLRKTNIEGTANIVNFCLAHHIKKLCHVSSIAALGDLKEYETTVSETTEWNPEVSHSDYAISKYGAEMELWRGQQEGLNSVILNPGIILGPGFWNSGSGLLFKQIATGFPFYTKGTTGIVSVNEVVKSMYFLMNSSISCERFIIVSETVSYEKLLETIRNGLQLNTKMRYAQPWLTELYWRWDVVTAFVFGKKRKLSRILAHSLHQTTVYSNEKRKGAFPFEFEYGLEYVLKLGSAYPKNRT